MRIKVTPELLQELRELYTATTQGSWLTVGNKSVYLDSTDENPIVETEYGWDDAWIAAAHNAMPALLDYIAELEERLPELRQQEDDETHVQTMYKLRVTDKYSKGYLEYDIECDIWNCSECGFIARDVDGKAFKCIIFDEKLTWDGDARLERCKGCLNALPAEEVQKA